ncbi:MAG TPA: DegT/DnrJ/EryC1/StrS family aminotransferase [Chloroflexia bacterium]|nr:DegT/DnrJ/EryC1/StrS family aminotransferase [Chloroflexia bacterium]
MATSNTDGVTSAGQNLTEGELALFGGKAAAPAFPAWPQYGPEEEAGLLEVLHSGEWGGYNPAIPELESKFATRHGASYGIAMANGTLSLVAALQACGIGDNPEDEVIVPSYTFFASASSVLLAGASLRLADVDPVSLTLDPAEVEASITSRTRAVMPVHFAGHPANLTALQEICKKHNLVLLEDAAQAHGASFKGKPAGSWGDLGSFSFQASKNMTAGEGGMIISNNEELATKVWALTNQGRKKGGKWYEHYVLGANYRITGFQAAILLAQLDRLDAQVELRQANAAILDRELRANPQLGLSPIGRTPDTTSHAYHIYVTRYHPEVLNGLARERFVEALVAEGIPCSTGYPMVLDDQPVFHAEKLAGRVHIGEVPNSRQAVAEVVWFIQRVLLGSEQDTYRLLEVLEKVRRNRDKLKSGN